MPHACRLYLATKLANPHYRPEIAAQTTLVNFCVTEDGLEEQLLAAVVDHERPDLQARPVVLGGRAEHDKYRHCAGNKPYLMRPVMLRACLPH